MALSDMPVSASSPPTLTSGDVRLPAKMYQDKLEEVLIAGGLQCALEDAMKFVTDKVPNTAAGKRCALTTACEIKSRCVMPDDHFSASGSLAQLDLRSMAINLMDVGCMQMVIDQALSMRCLHELIGPIAINVDTWSGADFADLKRGDNDGVVQALCLMIYWCQSDTEALDALIAFATDLTFKFQKMGKGLWLLFSNDCVWFICLWWVVSDQPIAVAILDHIDMIL
jgi:hypothetical protein